MTAPEVLDGTAEEISTELTVAPATPSTLFRTDNPVQVLERATEVATALKDVIQQQHLFVRIQNKDHILVEGWQTLGAMLGVTPVCEWTRPIENGWEARVIAQTLDGRQIGAAEAQCLSTEKRGPWKSSEDYAIRSMAQTRATSKALASVLRFVATLAGYSGTPAEDAEGMPRENGRGASAPPQGETIDDEQTDRITADLKAAKLPFGQIKLLLGAVGADAPKINRADSLLKAIRALTPSQGEQFEELLAKEASGD